MAYKRVVFVAQEWRQHEDPVTAELVVEASFPRLRKKCLVTVETIPGTDPPQLQYGCESVNCAGDFHCVLKKREEPDGSIVYYCDCDPIGGDAASATLSSSAKSKKSKKKAG